MYFCCHTKILFALRLQSAHLLVRPLPLVTTHYSNWTSTHSNGGVMVTCMHECVCILEVVTMYVCCETCFNLHAAGPLSMSQCDIYTVIYINCHDSSINFVDLPWYYYLWPATVLLTGYSVISMVLLQLLQQQGYVKLSVVCWLCFPLCVCLLFAGVCVL